MSLFVVCSCRDSSSLFVAGCLLVLFIQCGLFVCCRCSELLRVCCLLFVVLVCCLMFVHGSLLSVVCYRGFCLFVVCCAFFVVGCLLFVVCGVLFVVCLLLVLIGLDCC